MDGIVAKSWVSTVLRSHLLNNFAEMKHNAFIVDIVGN